MVAKIYIGMETQASKKVVLASTMAHVAGKLQLNIMNDVLMT